MKIAASIKPAYITEAGTIELQAQLDQLKYEHVQLIESMRELTHSRTGIGPDDPLQTLQRDRAAEIDDQIHRIEWILSTAKVVSQPLANDTVQIGSRVTLDMRGQQRMYMIVGSIEADPDRHKISYESPLGKSLLGKRVHDSFKISGLASKQFVATIIAIA